MAYIKNFKTYEKKIKLNLARANLSKNIIKSHKKTNNFVPL